MGGGLNGQDAYTGRIIPVVHIDGTDTARTLRAEHDGSPGPDTGFDVIAFHNQQDPDSGEVTHPLGTQDNGMAIAFSSKDHGADASEDVSPTLRASVHGNQGGDYVVGGYDPDTYPPDARPEQDEIDYMNEQAITPDTPLRCRECGELFNDEYATKLDGWCPPECPRCGEEKNVEIVSAVRTGMQVRRLTPTECERLQGFPDDYTRIPWNSRAGKTLMRPDKCPDGPRYRALGNSMAVPCMAWIGRKIQAVSE